MDAAAHSCWRFGFLDDAEYLGVVGYTVIAVTGDARTYAVVLVVVGCASAVSSPLSDIVRQ